MTTRQMSREEAINRTKKVGALVGALDALADRTGANDADVEMMLQLLDDVGWEQLTYLANVTPPSARTRRLVRETIERRVANRDVDPFADL